MADQHESRHDRIHRYPARLGSALAPGSRGPPALAGRTASRRPLLAASGRPLRSSRRHDPGCFPGRADRDRYTTQRISPPTRRDDPLHPPALHPPGLEKRVTKRLVRKVSVATNGRDNR